MFSRRAAKIKGLSWNSKELELLRKICNARRPARKKLVAELSAKRSSAAIRSKLRKIRIASDRFGSGYRSEKAEFTAAVAAKHKPRIVFEGYAGAGHQTIKWSEQAHTVYAAEKNQRKLTQLRRRLKRERFRIRQRSLRGWSCYSRRSKLVYVFAGDAVVAAASLCSLGKSVDIVDLDTCGSTIPTTPLFLKLLRPKILVITHGEFHSLRFGRQDVLTRVLGLTSARRRFTRSTLSNALERALRFDALRAGNEVTQSFWLRRSEEKWLGTKSQGMLRRVFRVSKPRAAADCLNRLLDR